MMTKRWLHGQLSWPFLVQMVCDLCSQSPDYR